MTAALVAMAPRWIEQPAAPPAVGGRRAVTPAASAYLRAHRLTVDDLAPSSGVVRLGDVVAHVETSASTAISGSDPGSSAEFEHDREARTEQDSSPSGRVWARAVVEGGESNELRVARLIRGVAAALRDGSRGGTVTASVTVVGTAEPADLVPPHGSVVIHDVWSLQPEGLARRIAQGPSPEPTGEDRRPGLVVVDGTRLDVDRLEPSATADLVVAIAKPQKRVVPLTTSDGAEVIAIRDVAEVVVTYRGWASPALAVRVATDGARAFATAVAT